MTGRAIGLHGSPASRGAEPRGFSVIELLIALILIGLIAGMAVPRINYERYRADAAMRTVRSTLQMAQRSAIMRQTNVTVSFDASGHQLRTLEDANNDCVADPTERQATRPLEEGARLAVPPSGYSGPAAAAVVTADPCLLAGLPTVQFLRDGAASSDVEVYLTSSQGVSTDFRLIRVLHATGRTLLYRYDGSTWRTTN